MSNSPVSPVSADPTQHDIESYEPDGSAEKEYLSEIIQLPGFGEAGEKCESLVPTGFCESGHVQLGSQEPCSTRTCPVHWDRWRREAVRSMVERLAAARFLEGGPQDIARRAVHLITAPDQDRRWTTGAFWQQRSTSYEPARKAGAVGGYCVPHPYGTSERGDEEFGSAVAAGMDPEVGKWSYLRTLAGDDWEAMQQFTAVRPHNHQIAIASDVDAEAVEAIEEESGWVVNNVRSLPPLYVKEAEVPVYECLGENYGIERTKSDVVAEGFEAMVGLAMYLLSHAAVQPKTGELSQRQTVTPWGAAHQVTPEEDLPEGVWIAIQNHVEEALMHPRAFEDESGATVHQCARDGCEAAVQPVYKLNEWLADPDHTWFDSLKFEQQLELLGAHEWLSDKPPPGVGGEGLTVDGERRRNGGLPPEGFDRSPRIPPGVETPEEYISWLQKLGRRRYERQDMPVLTAVMSP